MKIKNTTLCLIIIACSLLNVGKDFEEYKDLENKNVPVIKKEDLPEEFSHKNIINEVREASFVYYRLRTIDSAARLIVCNSTHFPYDTDHS